MASDLAAWQQTVGQTGCNQEYPASATGWGLAATTGAYTKVHIDCDGFSTYIQCKAGSKWWVFIGPPEDQDMSIFASWEITHALQTQNPGFFSLVETAKLRVEAVLLTPGTDL